MLHTKVIDIKEKNIPYVKMLDLLSIAKESDFISIHVHLNKETVNLIDKVFFENMKIFENLKIFKIL